MIKLAAVFLTAFTAHAAPVVAHHHVRHHLAHHVPGCESRRCDVHVGRWYYDRHHPRPRARLRSGPYTSGWAIPEAIVNCESGGQNLPPNSAGASGYYQIIPGTWWSYGGGRYASEAYQASRSEQGIVAASIWDGGKGADQWVCKA